MAYYFITASKDASVYLQQPNQNTGLDEILEVSKVYYGNIKDVSRSLIKFDLNVLSNLIDNNIVSIDAIKLLLRETESQEIPLRYTILAHPISGSWEMGNGTRFDKISTSGVTWNYREGDSRVDWLNNGLTSGSDSNPNDGTGGTWYTLVSASQNFDYESSDLNIDVTNIVNTWLSGTLPNEGFIIKYPNQLEGFAVENNDDVDTNDYGQLKFFGKETNTIYQPKLVIGWDDQIFNTGSLQPVDLEDGEVAVRVKPLSKEYKLNTTKIIRLVGREKYPLKTFTNSFAYADVKYLPSTTYYQIKDYESNDVIIPFGEYSKVSCDSKGNYIKFDFTNWQPNRVYKIEFKIEIESDTIHFDDKITFKIVES
jgi:hypothetical protein